MTNLLYSRKLALSLPLIAIVYIVGLLLLPHQSASAYLLLGQRVTNQVVWHSQFQENQALYGFPAATRNHIRQGMYQWDDVNTGADFDVDEGTNDDAYVLPFAWSYSASQPNVPGRTTHAINSAGRIWFSAMALNRTWSWDDTSCAVDWVNETADVRVVSTHESGHLIRLGHDSSHPEAVMWPDSTCKLVTVDDDDLGVRAIYGTR